jgi:hypothetical protein
VGVPAVTWCLRGSGWRGMAFTGSAGQRGRPVSAPGPGLSNDMNETGPPVIRCRTGEPWTGSLRAPPRRLSLPRRKGLIRTEVPVLGESHDVAAEQEGARCLRRQLFVVPEPVGVVIGGRSLSVRPQWAAVMFVVAARSRRLPRTPLRALTTPVPTLPVAPVTTTRKPACVLVVIPSFPKERSGPPSVRVLPVAGRRAGPTARRATDAGGF